MFSTKLLKWFRTAKRDLPWRREPRDPYRVWVSEVMLQQTRVDVVVPYYLRFLRRFPTLASLAGASEDEVLALWSGLGYYARGRNLHRAARAAAAAGGLPRTAAALRELPGFGPYTAAAVASPSASAGRRNLPAATRRRARPRPWARTSCSRQRSPMVRVPQPGSRQEWTSGIA